MAEGKGSNLGIDAVKNLVAGPLALFGGMHIWDLYANGRGLIERFKYRYNVSNFFDMESKIPESLDFLVEFAEKVAINPGEYALHLALTAAFAGSLDIIANHTRGEYK